MFILHLSILKLEEAVHLCVWEVAIIFHRLNYYKLIVYKVIEVIEETKKQNKKEGNGSFFKCSNPQ